MRKTVFNILKLIEFHSRNRYLLNLEKLQNFSLQDLSGCFLF